MKFAINSQSAHTQMPLQRDVIASYSTRSIFARAAIAFNRWLTTTGAEAYINGLEIPDAALELLLNASTRTNYRYFPELLAPYEWLSQESDRLAENPQHLMQIQYNLPKPLFQLMLGETAPMYPKYTMALWDKGAVTLEQAQVQMLEDVIEKLGIEDGDEVLDLGCGWGAAANYILARFPHVRVTAVNLSHEQCRYIRQKMQVDKSDLSSERFSLYEADFNEVQFETKFDKIIAIGLFEHIGNLTRSCQKLAAYLNPRGKVFIHIISTQLPCNITHPFINQYIFPNMRVWNCDVLPQTNQDLRTIHQWYINGNNYAKTLKVWLKNFDDHQTQLQSLDYGMSYSKFRRMWRLYLLLCIQHFESGTGEMLGNAQYLLVHA
ncbi:class I SAM-dependent methyltransferase [Phormidesmis sp. 146-12]